jgi:hypothetical protein
MEGIVQMILLPFKFLFGKVIGLEKIPKEKRDKFVKEVAFPLLKDAVVSAVKSGGKEVMVSMKKEF